MTPRDGHIRVLPLHVANKIAAGEVVERPASVVKELVENAIDAGAKSIRISITQGGRKLISVQDDGCGMTRDDAILSLERQATSKILDVTDIEEIDTLGFRGEAIPSIASVSRFTITTRPAVNDEGTLLQINAGTLAEVRAAGCPPGTLMEVRDLFCNVPARRKFLRSYATEEAHVRQIFTVHALAHPAIAFSLTIDGREVYRLSAAPHLADRITDLFGSAFRSDLLAITPDETRAVQVSGFIEKPNLNNPTRHDQFIFINGRPASAPSIAYALKEAYPRRQGDVRPALILFVNLPPIEVDVNVHPMKREVRFRNNALVKDAIIHALEQALVPPAPAPVATPSRLCEAPSAKYPPSEAQSPQASSMRGAIPPPQPAPQPTPQPAPFVPRHCEGRSPKAIQQQPPAPQPPPAAAPVQVEFAVEPTSTSSKPWHWFKFLAQTKTGYLLIETDAGLVTLSPQAARERIAYEKLVYGTTETLTQTLLIPEVAHLAPADAVRIRTALPAIQAMGFQMEEFGTDTFKIDAVPQLIGTLAPTALLATIARDLAESSAKRGARWREELIAKSIARAFAGETPTFTEAGATELVKELCQTRMPYVCPRGKPIMIFTSTRELDRKFDRT